MKNGCAQAGMELVSPGGPEQPHGMMEALDTMLAAARRSWTRARTGAAANGVERAESDRLRDAFAAFTDAATRLEGAYAALQARVEMLSAELSRANGELDRQLSEKQALAERQAALLSALPAGVLVIDANGFVREANAAAKLLLGESIIEARCDDIAQRLAPTECQFEWMTIGSIPRRVSVQIQPLDSHGERIVLLHDVTDAHEARARIQRTERLASMGEMAARLAHQLRTPLAAAVLYAGQLERESMSSEERVRVGNRIMSRLRSLERVTGEVLRFVRGEHASVAAFDLSTLLHEVVEDVKPLLIARGIAFVLQDDAGGTALRGDGRGIAAAVLSLLENAAQATRPGGKVRLEAMANSRHVRIRVSDSGDGISPESLRRVFEPYYSTRAEGTGLGLAIVKSVVESHGGSVDVSSAEQCGATFTITLPRVDVDGPMLGDAMPMETADATRMHSDAAREAA